MPKLLMVATVAGTIRAFLLPYARHFKKLGWQVEAMSNGISECSDCLDTFDLCHEISFSRNPLDYKKMKGINEKIRGIVADGKYDIVHVHTPVAAFVTRFALRNIPKESRPKVVYTAHGFHFYQGGNFFKNAVFIALERLAGDWTDHIITINREDYEAALVHKIATKASLSLLPGIGLDLSRHTRKAVDVSDVKKAYEDLNMNKNDELFLMVAEFNPGKRHKDAIRALAETGKKNFHLAFAGTGSLEGEMRQLAFKLGVLSRVHFLGQRPDVPLLMLSSRAVVLPSEREGLSRSAMEAICLGIPVLGADVRGIRDLVTNPSRGKLFPVKKTAALAASMIISAAEPCAEQPKPDPLWDIGHLLKEHETLYLELLSAR